MQLQQAPFSIIGSRRDWLPPAKFGRLAEDTEMETFGRYAQTVYQTREVAPTLLTGKIADSPPTLDKELTFVEPFTGRKGLIQGFFSAIINFFKSIIHMFTGNNDFARLGTALMKRSFHYSPDRKKPDEPEQTHPPFIDIFFVKEFDPKLSLKNWDS